MGLRAMRPVLSLDSSCALTREPRGTSNPHRCIESDIAASNGAVPETTRRRTRFIGEAPTAPPPKDSLVSAEDVWTGSVVWSAPVSSLEGSEKHATRTTRPRARLPTCVPATRRSARRPQLSESRARAGTTEAPASPAPTAPGPAMCASYPSPTVGIGPPRKPQGPQQVAGGASSRQ